MPPRDPRYRPYRVALWVVWFVAITLSIGTVVVNVVRHLSGPHRPAATAALPTRMSLRVCVKELEQLNREQNERAWRLGADVGEEGALAAFDAWSRDWEIRVDDLADRCRLDASEPDPQGFGGRRELAAARDAVLAVHRAYRAQVNRFAQEGAELARQAGQALEGARRAVTLSPPP
ncbi:MAG TPA: hypothetical protein VFP50_16735 [Anaeromyxobacteraceae bacterium]|nr:hypothetical protein [Anaeromyxobacteraceae bacterium]